VVEPSPIDPDRQLEELCRVLNDFGVRYVVFGSQVARLNGVPLETLDVDVVPERVLAPVVFVHPFRLNPYSDSGVFVHPPGQEAM
jgi:hypothetical protein